MDLKTIQAVLTKSFNEYGLVSEDHSTDVLVAFMSVDLYRALNHMTMVAPVVQPVVNRRRSTPKLAEAPLLTVEKGEGTDGKEGEQA